MASKYFMTFDNVRVKICIVAFGGHNEKLKYICIDTLMVFIRRANNESEYVVNFTRRLMIEGHLDVPH